MHDINLNELIHSTLRCYPGLLQDAIADNNALMKRLSVTA